MLGSRIVTAVAVVALVALAAIKLGVVPSSAEQARVVPPPAVDEPAGQAATATIVLAGGCFWGVQGVFQHVEGVTSAVSGYAGGEQATAQYEKVGSGRTGHAESVQVVFDPGVVSLEQLLEVFWAAHDPTTLNRQGADVGTQYRSVILYHNEAQKLAAEKAKKQAQIEFSSPIVTEISPMTKFYKAEGYHQDYYRSNPRASYCAFVIRPKLEKLQRKLSKQSKP